MQKNESASTRRRVGASYGFLLRKEKVRKSLFVAIFAFLLACAVPSHAATQPHGILYGWTNPIGVTITANTLYCGTVSGTYTINWVLPSSTSYDWNTNDPQHTGVGGTKYYCAVTDTVGGIESSYSNEISATFPQVPPAPTSLTGTVH
jgi:hypothetical protein